MQFDYEKTMIFLTAAKLLWEIAKDIWDRHQK